MRPGLARALLAGLGAFVVAGLVVGLLAAAAGADAAPAGTAVGYLAGMLAWLWGFGAFGPWLDWALAREPAPGHDPATLPADWRRYFAFTTDHKVIGVQYLVLSFAFFVLAGLLALLMRIHLATPGSNFLGASDFTSIMSVHGTVMIAVALIAIVGGLGNFLVPLLIGARDMAFPRLNAVSFWILPPAGALIVASLFVGGFDTGWTAYPPLAARGPLGQQFFILTLLTAGAASIMGGVNFLTTVARLRAPGMSLSRLPIFVWSIVATSVLILGATSVLAGALITLLFDRLLGTAFYEPSRGGDPLLYQHLFWFYSHPAVYIMILPAFGTILEILPVHARKPLFAYRLAVASLFGIVGLSFIVWAHHMFVSGMPEFLHLPFMVSTELISVPTGVVFLSALGTIWLGRLRLATPMLFALGFISNFLIGGITGIFHADVPTDVWLTDSYWVVAHFHYTIMGGMIFALFAGIYHWFPKITGRAFDEGLGRLHFLLFFVGFNATFLPLFWAGIHGMRRRVADYPPELAGVNLVASLASFLTALAVLVFLVNVVRAWARGPRAAANPWRGHTLEWEVPSPPPPGNFPTPPRVLGSPYPYGVPGARHATVEAAE